MMNILAFKRWNKILVDFRDVPGTDLNNFVEYIFSKNLHQALPRGIKMGILVSEQSEIPKENELTSESRIEIRTFSSERDVMNWFE